MKDIKMIVTDLDNTLLRADKTISSFTASVLNRCQRGGLKVVFATARPIRTVGMFLDSIPCDAVIYHNGAVTYLRDRELCSFSIPANVVNNILLRLSLNFPDMRLSVEMDDMLYANYDVSTLWNNTHAVRTNFTDLPNKPADKIIADIQSVNTFKQIKVSHLHPEDPELIVDNINLLWEQIFNDKNMHYLGSSALLVTSREDVIVTPGPGKWIKMVRKALAR